MVNSGKAVCIYIATDDYFCVLVISTFICLSNLSKVFRTACGNLHTGNTCMLERFELRYMPLLIMFCSLNSNASNLSH